jgi:hypothetical protein
VAGLAQPVLAYIGQCAGCDVAYCQSQVWTLTLLGFKIIWAPGFAGLGLARPPGQSRPCIAWLAGTGRTVPWALAWHGLAGRATSDMTWSGLVVHGGLALPEPGRTWAGMAETQHCLATWPGSHHCTGLLGRTWPAVSACVCVQFRGHMQAARW